jgi:hypothetical protein
MRRRRAIATGTRVAVARSTVLTKGALMDAIIQFAIWFADTVIWGN